MKSKEPDQRQKAAGQRLGEGKASIALELVGYDKEVSAAMKYAFGNAFICKVILAVVTLSTSRCMFTLIS